MRCRRTYRATPVKRVDFQLVSEGRGPEEAQVGFDVGKVDVLAVVRWANGHFERPWLVKNSDSRRNVSLPGVAKLSRLNAVCRTRPRRCGAHYSGRPLPMQNAGGAGSDNVSWRQRGQAPFVQSTLRAAPRQTEPVPFARKTCRTRGAARWRCRLVVRHRQIVGCHDWLAQPCFPHCRTSQQAAPTCNFKGLARRALWRRNTAGKPPAKHPIIRCRAVGQTRLLCARAR